VKIVNKCEVKSGMAYENEWYEEREDEMCFERESEGDSD
jgi:hypothetical protein